MLSLWDATYIVCDVETTGSDPRSDRIIEIACVVVRSGEISQRIHTLINPHRFIPPFITQLTGISNADVASAPEEWDVMPIIARLLVSRTLFLSLIRSSSTGDSSAKLLDGVG